MLHITNIVIEKHWLILPSSTQLYHFVPLLMFQSQAFPFGLLCHKDTTRQELTFGCLEFCEHQRVTVISRHTDVEACPVWRVSPPLRISSDFVFIYLSQPRILHLARTAGGM